MHRSLAAALLAACGACGSGAKDAPACPTIDGKFKATSTLASTNGSCAQAKAVSVDTLDFSKGNYQFPVPGAATCKTTELGCDVKVHCTTPLLPSAAFVFEGTLSPDGSELNGTGTFTGSYQGCSQVVYTFDATQM